MKKILVLSLAFVMLLGLTSFASASESGKLLIWADENRLEVVTELAEEFEDDYGVPVEVQEKAFGDIRDSMRVEAPSGEGPDIIVGAHDWLGELVTNGLISPIDLSGIEDEFIDVSLEAFTWGEDTYAVPYAIESVGLIYNKDLVPNPPETFEEFREVVKENTNKEEEKYGFVMPQPDPFHTYPFMSAMGGYVFGMENGVYNPKDIGLNNEGAVKGLEKLNSLYAEEYVPYLDYQTMASLFKSGDAAMMLTGPWEFGNLEEAGINYGFAQLPTMEGQAPKPFSSVHGFMMSEFSENKMLAQAFIRNFIAREDTMIELYEKGGRPPVYKPAIEVAKEDPQTAGVLESARESMPMPSIPEMNAVWAAWEDALEVVLNQKQDVKPALDNAVEQIKDSLEQSAE